MIAADSSGNVYLDDTSNQRIQKFDSSGNFQIAWGRNVDSVNPSTGFEICTVAANCRAGAPGGLGGEMTAPQAVAADSSGNVYVGENGQGDRVQKFDSSGNFLLAWGKDVDSSNPGTGAEICTVAANCKDGSSGTLGGEFDSGSGIGGLATSPAGVAVSDRGNNRVQVFDSSGNFGAALGKDVVAGGGTGYEICLTAAACQAGSTGGLGGELNAPAGGAADSSGNAYVADTGNQRIQVANSLGSFLRAWGNNVLAAGGGGGGGGGVALSAPVFATSANLTPVSGTVLVELPGSHTFIPLSQAKQVPIGTIIDVRAGRVSVTTAKDRAGGSQTADFYGGAFQLLQPTSGKPMTILRLVDNATASSARTLAATTSRSHNRLWGNGHGNYQSRGRHGSATVRGTIWLTEDRPNGTFFKSKRDKVVVRDFKTHKKIVLRSGQHYLARGR